MASSLPTVPRVVFTIIEPISVVAGFLGAVRDPAWFVAEQIPNSTPALSQNSVIVALQLGNAYLLLGFIGLAVFATADIKAVRAYLFALWLGDIGHVLISALGLGFPLLKSPRDWNGMAWGNVAFTMWLFAMRSAYFLGIFGPHRVPAASSATKKTA